MNGKDINTTEYCEVAMCLTCERRKHGIQLPLNSKCTMLMMLDKTSHCCNRPNYWWISHEQETN